jgi:hypothetical protein
VYIKHNEVKVEWCAAYMAVDRQAEKEIRLTKVVPAIYVEQGAFLPLNQQTLTNCKQEIRSQIT